VPTRLRRPGSLLSGEDTGKSPKAGRPKRPGQARQARRGPGGAISPGSGNREIAVEDPGGLRTSRDGHRGRRAAVRGVSPTRGSGRGRTGSRRAPWGRGGLAPRVRIRTASRPPWPAGHPEHHSGSVRHPAGAPAIPGVARSSTGRRGRSSRCRLAGFRCSDADGTAAHGTPPFPAITARSGRGSSP